MLREKCIEQRGFSLPELGLVLLITGVSFLAAAQFTYMYTVNIRYTKTVDNLELMYGAIKEYVAMNGSYPCPANPTASPGDPDYGVSKCRDILDAAFDENNCTVVPGGISCTTVGSRDGDSNGHNDVVLIGVIPFRTILEGIESLHVREYQKSDGYGALFSYAVTETLTDTYPSNNLSTPYDPLHGSIAVLDENLNSHMSPAGEAQFVLFSHGMDNVGGYTPHGKLMENCVVPSTTLPPPAVQAPIPGLYSGNGKIETENCDNNDAIFVKGILSHSNNNNYFDDFLYYKGRGVESLWKRSLVSPLGESYIYNTNLGNIGIGTSQPDSKLHVKGDIRAENHLISPKYCEPGKNPGCDMDIDPTCGGECLDPNFLASDIGADARCPHNQIAYAIGENEIVCKDITWTIPNKTCQNIIDPDDGISKAAFIQGFSNKGNLHCCIPEINVCKKQCDTDPCANQIKCSCTATNCECVMVP